MVGYFILKSVSSDLKHLCQIIDVSLIYITTLLGGVRVAFDVGFERDELNTAIQNVDLANEQQHVVVVRRVNRGRRLLVNVS